VGVTTVVLELAFEFVGVALLVPQAVVSAISARADTWRVRSMNGSFNI
jgi:hypothetical protein